jgi:hypothetical protein
MTTAACTGIGACSSPEERWIDDEGDDAGEDDADTPDTGIDARPPRDARPDTKDSGHDASDASDASNDAKMDADGGDARKDAADAFAETGTPCSPVGATQSTKCGLCGTTSRVCKDPTDSGTPVWQEWGYCGNQVDGGCMPGTMQDVGCGKCGVMNVKCGNDCRFPATGSCKDAGPCWPGEVEFSSWLSCDTPDLGRTHVCGADCRWGDYTDCEAPPSGITIPETPGERTGLRVALGWWQNIGGYISGTSSTTPTTCSWYSSSSQYPYAVVELKNPSSDPAQISVWTYPATGAGALSSPTDVGVRVLSADPEIPEGGILSGWDAGGAIQKCVSNRSTYCCADHATDPSACPSFVSGTYCNSPYWGGFMLGDGTAVTVPANTSYYLFVQNLYSTLPGGAGDIMIGVKRH